MHAKAEHWHDSQNTARRRTLPKKALSASADSAFLTSACQALGNPYSARLLLTTSYTSADSLPEARIRSSSAFISA
ncbi:hypothetical protein DND36_27305 [Pseudomonas savastanoi pv. glycinea]|nr:hypothetical protein DND36_27305 [Pseudomonas savastanoi pv. glycinea]